MSINIQWECVHHTATYPEKVNWLWFWTLNSMECKDIKECMYGELNILSGEYMENT